MVYNTSVLRYYHRTDGLSSPSHLKKFLHLARRLTVARVRALCYNLGVAENEKREIISFEAGRARKRAARMLAAKLDYEDVTTLLNAFLDKQIAG